MKIGDFLRPWTPAVHTKTGGAPGPRKWHTYRFARRLTATLNYRAHEPNKIEPVTITPLPEWRLKLRNVGKSAMRAAKALRELAERTPMLGYQS